jgi:hypothetical protein
MRTFAKRNMLVMCLALAAFSCQQGEGFLAGLATADTRFYEMEFTAQGFPKDSINEEVAILARFKFEVKAGI